MAVVDVIYDDDNLTIFGPPDVIDLSVDVGAQGNSGTISVGSVSTTSPGTVATVTNVGSTTNAILNFTIPQGLTGSTGPQGVPGDTVPISTEQVQDAAVPLFNHGDHIGFTVTYDDPNNKLIFQSTNPVTTEQIEDIVGALFNSGSHSGATVTYDDANSRISIAVTGVSYNNVSVTNYSSVGNLPSASSNSGKWAYVIDTESMYYSTGSAWIKVENYTQGQIKDEVASVFDTTHTAITTNYNSSTKKVTIVNDGIHTIFGNSNEIDVSTLNNSASISLPFELITPGNLSVLGSASVVGDTNLNGNLTIDGSLIVSGSVTSISTTNLVIQDNIVLLNGDVVDTPVLNAGLEVERGNLNNVSIIWNEGSDKWQFTNDGILYEDLGAEAQLSNQKQTNFYDIVRDYGASDNETNVTTKVQNALNAARDAGGGIVYIPNGLWNLYSGLRIYSNTTLLLSNKAYMRKLFSGASMLWNGDNGASYSGYNGQTNIIIQGGTWDARATAFPTTPANIFSFAHSQHLTVRDATFLNVGGYHAIEINSTRKALVENCRFLGYVDTGDRDFSEAVQIDGAFRASLFGEFGSYDKTTCDDITISNCYFGSSGFGGTVAWPNAVGSHSADTDAGSVLAERWHTNVKIINNHFEGMTEWAVRSDAVWREAIISGNTFKFCSGGIGLGFKTRATTESWHASYNFTITNNIFQESTGTSRDGIQARNIDGMIIANNIIRFSGRHGIYLIDGFETSVSDNRFEWINQHGIFLDGMEDTMVMNNLMKNVSTATNNTYSYIIYANSPADCSNIGNRGFKGASGNTASFGLRIPNGTGMRSFGNNFGSGSTTGYSDNSTSPSTSTANS